MFYFTIHKRRTDLLLELAVGLTRGGNAAVYSLAHKTFIVKLRSS